MLELMTAINAALPREQGLAPGQVSRRPLVTKDDSQQRVELYIETMESKFYGSEDVPMAEWFDEEPTQERLGDTMKMLAKLKDGTLDSKPVNQPPPADDADADDADADTEDGESEDGEEGSAEVPALEEGTTGWVIELSGYHFHNNNYPMAGSEYVKRTLIKNLMTGSVQLPTPGGPNPTEEFTMEELGIGYALIAEDGGMTPMKIPNPDYQPPDPYAEEEEFDVDPLQKLRSKEAKKDEQEVEQFLKPKTHKFKVQFLWQPTTLSERLEKRRLAAEGITDDGTEGDL